MMKFCALNESSVSGDEDCDPELGTREAQEEEAYSMYNLALKCQSQGDMEESEKMFRKVLEMEFIVQMKPSEKDKSPALNLKYLVYKNLAVIASKKEDYHSSVESYLEAMSIDATDVNMWYHMGRVSLYLPNYTLSRLCFEEGLKCNPNHWPCLDNVITVMYALNDYANCLHYIAKALDRECHYLKGLAFKDQIYKEDPSLKSFCEGYFKKCDSSIHSAEYDKDEGYQFIEESLEMREKKQSLCKPCPLPILTLKYPIKEFTWKAVGESLIYMYDHVTTADPYISLSCKIDLSQYVDDAGKIQELECEKAPSPTAASSSSEACSTLSQSPGSAPSSQSSQQHVGLLQLATTTQGYQEAVLTDSQVEMEVDDAPNICSDNLLANVYSLTLPQTEVRATDPVIYSDAPLGNRKMPKRKRLLSELNDLGGKRRSTRVRNTTVKRSQDNVNYQELLQKFLPSRLIGDDKFDDQGDDSCVLSQDKINGDHTYGQAAEYGRNEDGNQDTPQKNSLCLIEKEDIQDLILCNQSNGGLLDLLYKYIMKLGSKSNYIWPKALPDVFSAAFIRLRKHITMPNLFCHETENIFIKETGMAVLTFSELKVDQWYLSTGHTSALSPSFSPKIASTTPSFQIGPDSIGKNFHADMEFLMQLTVRRDAMENDWLQFTVRALWLKAKFHSVEGEVDMAVSCMDKLVDVLQKESESSLKITVSNCYFSNVITIENVQQQFESLQRCQSLEEVQRLYEHGAYQSVVDLLVLTFNQPRSKSKQSADGGIPERHAQLILLQDSLWKLKNYQECIRWSEVSFNEAIEQYLNAGTISARSDWSDTIAQLLSGLDRCAKMNKDLLNNVEDSKLVRLTQNLILVICLQMENYDFSSDLSLLTVLPWILLYRLILNEELKVKALASQSLKQSQSSADENEELKIEVIETNSPRNSTNIIADFDFSSSLPSSLMLLFTAHEYLGRRSWCCVSDGILLLHCVDVMITELRESSKNPHPYREDLETGLEQCFYCLYGHPHKRTKAKHLQEHNAQQITLTTERAVQIFEYFKPNILPEFDSYRTSTVSAELENLLKRISLLVPPEDDPSNRVDAYSSYIEGGTDKCPTFARDKSLNVVVKDLYYLLGDYYFKNKEFSKAIRFYLLDICVNPDRQDSWAGMALSRSSQLDQKLNSYELRNEATIYRKSSAALRCFEHALELNSATTSLWIEYGSLAYVLHSHASRQLKQDAYCDGVRDLLKNKKEEMLTAAERCFRAANQCEEGTEPEEAWLHHYMLGKISQKQEKEPKVFLDHYQKALLYLHEDEARYPRKIQYHNPPELSIEVLEVYYRIHASCLKFLSRYESEGIMLETLKIFRDCISDVATGPFANFQEKLRVESHSSSVSESETEDFIIHPAVSTDVKSPTDHNYYNEVQDMVRKGTIDYKYEDRRQSIDSSSESQDSAAVKELINALVSVVTERFIEDCREPHSDRNASLADPNIPMTQAKPDNTIFNKEVEESVSEEIVSTTVTINANETPMEIDVVDKPSSEINKNNMQEISLECKASHNSSDRLTESKMLSVKLEKSANSCSEHAYTLEERLELTNYISSTPASGNSSKKIKIADSKEILSIASDKSENAVSENCKSILSCEVSNVVSEILAVIQAKEVDLSKKHVADVTEESNLNINKGDKKCDLAETALNVNSITLKSKTVMTVLDEMVCSTTDSKESVPVKEASLQQKEKEYLQNVNKKQGKNEDNSLDEKGSSGSHKMSAKDREASKAEINDLILLCLDAMRECLQRFIQHYKSLYRIAYYYCHSKKNKNLQWAREILLAATPLVNNYPSMPGLFAERKNTNFFNGIWRAPSNEIDRPGSFGAHMYRSVLLLTDVLWKQRDYNMLLNLTQQLYRTPDFGKKYMRDAERTFLARESYERCVTILRDQMNSLLQEEPPPEESRLTCCLLEIYRSCQTLLKAGIYIDETNELLEEAYSMYKIGEVDPYPSVLEQAIKFCQMQLGKSYQY